MIASALSDHSRRLRYVGLQRTVRVGIEAHLHAVVGQQLHAGGLEARDEGRLPGTGIGHEHHHAVRCADRAGVDHQVPEVFEHPRKHLVEQLMANRRVDRFRAGDGSSTRIERERSDRRRIPTGIDRRSVRPTGPVRNRSATDDPTRSAMGDDRRCCWSLRSGVQPVLQASSSGSANPADSRTLPYRASAPIRVRAYERSIRVRSLSCRFLPPPHALHPAEPLPPAVSELMLPSRCSDG